MSFDLYMRVGVAVAAGLALGLEREFRGHPAGLRTHVLVSVGAALFTLAGAYGFADLDRGPNVDPARIAAQVASGIGFIGAGAILRIGASIKGLTTAATLWLAASVGVAAGAGAYDLVIVSTSAVLVVLVGIPYVKPSRWSRKETVLVQLGFNRGSASVSDVLERLKSSSFHIEELSIEDDKEQKRWRMNVQLRIPRAIRHDALVERLGEIPGVRDIEIGGPDSRA